MPSRSRFLASAALSGLAGCAGGESVGRNDSTRVETTATTGFATTSRTTETTAVETTTETDEPTRESPDAEAVRWRVAFDDAVGTPTVGEDRLYVPVGEPHYGTVVGLDGADGTLVVRGGAANSEFVASVDESDGTVRWSFETHEQVSRPVVADGRVYVGSERGAVRSPGN